MRGLMRAGWMFLAVALLMGCGEAGPPDTSATTRSLLSQPRAGDLSTVFDPTRLSGDGPSIEIDQLGWNMGSLEAPVKVIEFVDFGCGYCRLFQMETFATLHAEFIETDMVEWKFMPFVSGMFGNSEVVTEAAECTLEQAPGLFAVFTDRLWSQQADWKGSDEPGVLARSWAVELGADGEGFDSCMQEDRRLERVTSATALAAQLGVRSTPTFWIVGGGPIQGALPLETFRVILTEAYGQFAPSAG